MGSRSSPRPRAEWGDYSALKIGHRVVWIFAGLPVASQIPMRVFAAPFRFA